MTASAVILGAGNIGRGFIGQLLWESGYRVCFVDVDARLVAALQEAHAYTLRLVEEDEAGGAPLQTDLRVGPVDAILATDGDAVADALAGASLAATAVGARALAHIAPSLAAGIARRRARGVAAPLNILVCENLKDAPRVLRDLVVGHLGPEDRAYLADHVGFVEVVVGRMVPAVPEALRAADPTLIIAEPYKELPADRTTFVGPVPEVVGLQPATNFSVYTARKLYLHNAGHALLGYLGYRRGYTYAYEAVSDRDIRATLEGAWDEAVRGISAHLGADEAWLRAHTRDLARRFANRALGDPVVRLAQDPLRKLAPEDRLVGAARIAEYAGIVPVHLAWGIAAALAYDEPSDPMAVALQRRVADEGPERVLSAVCGIAPEEALGAAVLARYRRLRQGAGA